MQIDDIIDFLGTTTLSYSFSPNGLQYLSLKEQPGRVLLDLQALPAKEAGLTSLIILETKKFLATGKHNMPLDFSGFTDFQQQVFQMVSQISPGTIKTYKEIAQSLGKPGAVQAVGNTIAKNPVAYFLPVHRVLPQKGLPICKRRGGNLREKLLLLEGHDLARLRGNYPCKRKECCLE